MQVSKSAKMVEWLTLSLRRPREAFDRVATVIDVTRDALFARAPAYRTSNIDEVLCELFVRLSINGTSYDAELARVESSVQERMGNLGASAPIDRIHSADRSLARLCYVCCRLVKPGLVLETGVAYGVTSAFILEAMAANDHGALHSVDLPPLGPQVSDYVGVLVADGVRNRWTLHRGVTKRVLPRLLPTLGPIDMFVHDSLHTYKNISMELDLVTPRLTSKSIVIADDVHENVAFEEWVGRQKPTFVGVVKEERKDSILGVAVVDA